MPSPAALKAGKAVIELGLDSEGVATGLDKLQLRLKSVGQSMQQMGKTMAIAGGVITGAVAASVKSFISLGDELDKAAIRTGLSVESVSALKFAAEQSGTSLNTLERGLRNMAKNGLDTSVESILRFSDQLAAIEDPAERARFAMENLGLRAGTELIPLLGGGSDALRQLMQLAADTGNVMSGDTSAAAAKLGDAIDALKTQFVTLMVHIATAVSGDLQVFIDRTVQITTGIINWMQQHQTLIRVVAISGAALLALGTTMLVLGKAFVALSVAIGVVRTALTFLSKHPWLVLITLGVLAIGEMTGAFDALARKIDEVAGVTSNFADGNQELLKDLERLKIEAMNSADGLEEMEDVQLPDVGELADAKLEREMELSSRFEPVASAVADSSSRGASRVESLFDTRLANQVFGSGEARIAKDQLNVQRKMERHLDDIKSRPAGIPVV